MRKINETFLANLKNNNYWHSFEHEPNFSNAPKEIGKYKVLVKFCMSCIIMNMEAIWNGCDWISLIDRDEITPMVIGWRKENKDENC